MKMRLIRHLLAVLLSTHVPVSEGTLPDVCRCPSARGGDARHGTARHGRERCVRARGGRVEDGETANSEERTGRPTSSAREGGRARWTSDHRGTTVCDGCCLLARLRTNRYQPSPFPPLARSPLHHLPRSPKRKRPWSLAAAARPRTAGSSRPCPVPHAPNLDRHAPPGTSTEPTTNR